MEAEPGRVETFVQEDFTAPQVISSPRPHDVLLGGDGASNNHMRNIAFHVVMEANKDIYCTYSSRNKFLLVRSIVEAIQQQCPQGRFLEKSEADNLWYESSYSSAVENTKYTLREFYALGRTTIASAQNNK